MRSYGINSSEVEGNDSTSLQDKERAALESLIDYALRGTCDARFEGSGEAMAAARQQLCDSVFR